MSIDMAILRAWAEAKVSGKYFATDHDLPVARHILDAMPTPTMADIAWDDEVHAGLCAEHPKHGLVLMLVENSVGDIQTLYVEEGRLRSQWTRPADLTPVPGTKIDLTPRREPATPDHPTFLSSVEDYDNAPAGTVIAYADDVAVKRDDGRWYWSGQSGTFWAEDLADADPCTIVRWGK